MECVDDSVWHGKWGIWEVAAPLSTENHGRRTDDTSGKQAAACSGEYDARHLVRLCIGHKDIRGEFPVKEDAAEFKAQQLKDLLGWPRQALVAEPYRDPTWDHPEELEPFKEYSFMEPYALSRAVGDAGAGDGAGRGSALTQDQLQQFCDDGFLLGLPVLDRSELQEVLAEFEELLGSRIDNAPSDELRFRAAHTISRPLHQELVARLAKHDRVLAIVEDILGPCFCCWSAHLFCKLPGDPTEQPWHQDAGFWPIAESRALTLWIAFDEVDAANSSVTFIKGSHQLGRVCWQQTPQDITCSQLKFLMWTCWEKP